MKHEVLNSYAEIVVRARKSPRIETTGKKFSDEDAASGLVRARGLKPLAWRFGTSFYCQGS